MTAWPDPSNPGFPLWPKQDGWHMLCEQDVDGGEPMAVFVLWWDSCGLWFDRRGDPPSMAEPPDRAAEFHGYVGRLVDPCSAPSAQPQEQGP